MIYGAPITGGGALAMKPDATVSAFAVFAVGPPASIVWAGAREGGNPFTPVLLGIVRGFVAVACVAYALVRAAERRWPEKLSPAMEVRRYLTVWVLVVALLGGSAYVFLLLRG
jgi:hypothetical protein